MRKSRFSFRPVERADLDLLSQWHRRRHVLEWWPDPPSVQELQGYCLAPMDSAGDMHFYIALRDGLQPVGFIQSYRAVACHKDGWWLDEQDSGVMGIDQFLANPEDLNQGLGTDMARAFVETLLLDLAVSRIQADPDPLNHRAIRCYQKAGFQVSRQVDTPDGRALLMYRDR